MPSPIGTSAPQQPAAGTYSSPRVAASDARAAAGAGHAAHAPLAAPGPEPAFAHPHAATLCLLRCTSLLPRSADEIVVKSMSYAFTFAHGFCCTSAARGRPCSTRSSPGTMADVPAAHRGHGSGALTQEVEAILDSLGWLGLGRRRAAGVPERARGAAWRGRPAAARRGQGLPLLRHAGGAGRGRAGSAAGPADALRRPLARPRPERGAAGRTARGPAQGAADGQTDSPTWCGARSGRERAARRHVLLRGDGTPTYILAVVVDDLDMGITHVIRGHDHLTNTFRQIRSTTRSARPARFAHMPLIRRRRRQAQQAARRVSVTEYRSSASCPRPCATTCCGSAGGTATRRSSDRAGDRLVRARRVGRSPARFDLASCRASTRTICASGPTRSWSSSRAPSGRARAANRTTKAPAQLGAGMAG